MNVYLRKNEDYNSVRVTIGTHNNAAVIAYDCFLKSDCGRTVSFYHEKRYSGQLSGRAAVEFLKLHDEKVAA